MIYSFMIYYNQETRAGIPSEFIPLDNCVPERNEIFEIEPILRFIVESEIENDSFYGFFSPKLFEKTGLCADDIFPIDEKEFKHYDIISISPYPISERWFKNPIHQGKQHGSFRWRFDCLVSETKISAFELQEEFIYGTPNPKYFLYSHYFWAKGNFWKKWAENILKIFEKEMSDEIFRSVINADCVYKDHIQCNCLVFLLERVAGFLAFSNKSTVVEYQLKKRILYDSKHRPSLPNYLAPIGIILYLSEILFIGKSRFPSISHALLRILSKYWGMLDLELRKILRKPPPRSSKQ